jgi:hypothetical protein
MDEPNWNEVLDRLIRIRSLADRAGTLAEAEAATAALTRLLLRYNLSLADLDAAPDGSGGTVLSEEFQVANSASWRHYLLHALAQGHVCRAIRFPGTNRAMLIGHPHSLTVVKELYAWLSVAIPRLANDGWEERRDREAAQLLLDSASGHRRFARARAALPGAKARRAWIAAFRAGAVDGIWRRLLEEREALRQETDPSRWAIVPAMDAEVEAFMNQHFAGVGSYSMTARDADGYHAGREAGYAMNVSAPRIEE